MDVSENSGFPTKIIHFNRVFHDKLCILGYPYFWKHPYMYSCIRRDEKNYIKQTLRVSTLQNISEFHAKYTHNLTAKETDTHITLSTMCFNHPSLFCPPYVHQPFSRPSARSCPTYVIAEVVLWQVHAFQLDGFEGSKSHSFPSNPGQQKTNCHTYPLAN